MRLDYVSHMECVNDSRGDKKGHCLQRHSHKDTLPSLPALPSPFQLSHCTLCHNIMSRSKEISLPVP